MIDIIGDSREEADIEISVVDGGVRLDIHEGVSPDDYYAGVCLNRKGVADLIDALEDGLRKLIAGEQKSG